MSRDKSPKPIKPAKVVKQVIKGAGGKNVGKHKWDMTEAVKKEKKGK